MTLDELQQEVYVITKRPDLTAETLLAVRQATLSRHQLEFWAKDILETGLNFGSSSYRHELVWRSVIPRFRAAKWLRKCDASGNPGAFFEPMIPEQVLDSYGNDRSDVFYVAGDSIEIKSSTEFQYALFGCYVNPNITLDCYSSWIAIDHPYAIVYKAAEIVFKMIGKGEEFAAWRVLEQEEVQNLKIANLPTVGF